MSADLQAQLRQIQDQLAHDQRTSGERALSNAERKPANGQTAENQRQLEESARLAKAEALRQFDDKVNRELEEAKKKWERDLAVREAESKNIEEEKKRLEAEYAAQAERIKADLDAQWQARYEQDRKALAEQSAEQARLAAENRARIAQDQTARKVKEELDKATRQAEAVVGAYWEAVGNRDVQTALGMWVDLPQERRNSLRKIIQAKESLELLAMNGTLFPPDAARVDFEVRYKDQGTPQRGGSGSFALRQIDGAWKIESITKWSNQ